MEAEAKLLTLISPREIREMMVGIEKAVNRSVVLRPQPVLTEAQRISRDEWLRRARWCVEHVLEVKKAKRWPVERLVDHVAGALVEWLDGKYPTVSDSASWAQPGE
jgi:hypothetical protein